MSTQNSRLIDKLSSISFVLLIILICEISIGSSGRWLEFGPISIRMTLFALVFLTSLPLILTRLKEVFTNRVILVNIVFGIYLIFGAIMGFAAGNARNFIVADITSFMFIALLPTALVIIDSKERLKKLLQCQLIAIIVLALSIIFLHFLVIYASNNTIKLLNYYMNQLSLGGLFYFEDHSYRIYFRSSIFFILGFAYSFFVLLNAETLRFKKQWLHYISIVVNTIAVVLTYTRSIWVGYAIALIVICVPYLRKHKLKMVKLFTIILCGFAVFLVSSFACVQKEIILTNAIQRVVLGAAVNNPNSPNLTHDDGNGDLSKEIQIESEIVRMRTKEKAYEEISKHPVLGSGLGANLDEIRDDGKIEYMYLDVTFKLGFVGLLLYLGTLILPFAMYLSWRLKKKEKGVPTDLCFLLLAATLAFCITSAYNPFMLSPLGMSLYCVAVAALSIYQKEEEKG